jgi:beta-phosphoglucomutase family hydrolase
MIGLPDGIRACLFDLDGVLTQTATVHAAAWKLAFDDLLRARAKRTGTPFVPFDAVHEYDEYVDGKPRADGVRSFLAARGISLPDGSANDAASAETVAGVGRRKNEAFLEVLEKDGVQAYEGSRRYLDAVTQAGLRRAVVSSSTNCAAVLARADLARFFETRIDGKVSIERKLAGKPAPDTYLAAAEALGTAPAQCAVFEDALAGVEAGRAGRFGYVVGVDRQHQAAELREHGAVVVVSDLSELLGRP